MYVGLSDIIIFLGIAQGFFLALMFPVLNKNNMRANKVLSILLVFASVMLLARTLSLKSDNAIVLQWINLADVFIFLFGPLGHFYVKRLLFGSEGIDRIHPIHFLPALAHLFFCLSIFRLTSQEYYSIYKSGGFLNSFLIIEGAAIALNFLYLFKVKDIIRAYKLRTVEQLSFNQSIVQFSRVLSLSVMLLLIVWLLSFLGGYFLGVSWIFFNYETIWIGMSIVIYVIGYYAIRQPEIFRISKNKQKPRKRLNAKEANELKSKLEVLIVQDKVYLNNELTLKIWRTFWKQTPITFLGYLTTHTKGIFTIT